MRKANNSDTMSDMTTDRPIERQKVALLRIGEFDEDDEGDNVELLERYRMFVTTSREAPLTGNTMDRGGPNPFEERARASRAANKGNGNNRVRVEQVHSVGSSSTRPTTPARLTPAGGAGLVLGGRREQAPKALNRPPIPPVGDSSVPLTPLTSNKTNKGKLSQLVQQLESSSAPDHSIDRGVFHGASAVNRGATTLTHMSTPTVGGPFSSPVAELAPAETSANGVCGLVIK